MGEDGRAGRGSIIPDVGSIITWDIVSLYDPLSTVCTEVDTKVERMLVIIRKK